jgi:DNA-binding transcriptional LysR family regulator
MTTLEVDAVQAFVTIADHRSFTRAAKALGTTQGALSVKLKRLEERVGHRLIERTPRLVRLSAEGAQFLEVRATSLPRMTAPSLDCRQAAAASRLA